MNLRLLITCFFFGILNAQANIQMKNTVRDSTIQNEISKNVIHAELFGNSFLMVSVNYERMALKLERQFLYGRIGFSYLPDKDKGHQVFSIPIEFTVLKGNRNYFEFGSGITYVANFPSILVQTGQTITEEAWSTSLRLALRIGYRYQRVGNGFFLKVGITPLYKIKEFNSTYELHDDRKFIFSAGLAVGYSF